MITEILKLIAPGTPIRDGLENILKAKTGALIVISDTKEVLDLVDGGFRLDIDYTSSRCTKRSSWWRIYNKWRLYIIKIIWIS